MVASVIAGFPTYKYPIKEEMALKLEVTAVGRISSGVAILSCAAGIGYDIEGQDAPLAADFSEVYSIGGFDAPPWAEFAVPPLVSFDGAGRLYALDRTVGQVVVVDRDGELVRTVGRKGEGPGEFYQVIALVVWPEGHLAVADAGRNAYHIFDLDGEFERSARMGSGTDPMRGMGNARIRVRRDPVDMALIAQGNPSEIDAFTGLLGEMVGVESSDDGGVSDRGLERLNLAGEVVVAEAILEGWHPPDEEDETQEALSPDDLADPTTMLESMAGLMLGGTRWFEPQLLWDVLPDGRIVYSDSTAYDIKLTDRGGQVMSVLSRPLRPVSVTRRIRNAVRDHELEDLEKETGDREGRFADRMRELMREEIENRKFYEEISVLVALRASWDGTLWIQRIGGEPLDEPGFIDVMRTDGAYVGTFLGETTQMPDAFGPDGLAAFVELDELEVPRIVVKRLPLEVR